MKNQISYEDVSDEGTISVSRFYQEVLEMLCVKVDRGARKLTFNFFCINLENLTFERLVCQIVDSKSKSGIL